MAGNHFVGLANGRPDELAPTRTSDRLAAKSHAFSLWFYGTFFAALQETDSPCPFVLLLARGAVFMVGRIFLLTHLCTVKWSGLQVTSPN